MLSDLAPSWRISALKVYLNQAVKNQKNYLLLSERQYSMNIDQRRRIWLKLQIRKASVQAQGNDSSHARQGLKAALLQSLAQPKDTKYFYLTYNCILMLNGAFEKQAALFLTCNLQSVMQRSGSVLHSLLYSALLFYRNGKLFIIINL